MSELNKGWIGVDLDGTLAEMDKDCSLEHIGKPIPKMVKRVQDWVNNGYTVKIFTARASGDFGVYAIKFVKKWCIEHVGYELEVVCAKDYAMIELWDDRAIGVGHNTGEIMSGSSSLSKD